MGRTELIQSATRTWGGFNHGQLKEQLIEELFRWTGLKPEASGQINELRQERSSKDAALNLSTANYSVSKAQTQSYRSV